MSTNKVRPTWFGMSGEGFPSSPMPDSRGAVGIQDPIGADDVAAVCLRGADGVLAWSELALADEVATAPPWRRSELARGIFTQVVANGNATTFSTLGGTAPTITTAGSSTNADTSTHGAFIQMSTSTVSFSDSSLVFGAPGNAIRAGWDPWLDFVAQASTTTTNMRVWFGLFGSAPNGSSDPVTSGFGFRYDTGVGDSTLHSWTNDGSSGGLITDLGLTWSSGANFHMSAALSGNGTQLDFYANDVLLQTATTNLPVTTDYLVAGAYCRTLNAAQKAMRVGRFSVGYAHQ